MVIELNHPIRDETEKTKMHFFHYVLVLSEENVMKDNMKAVTLWLR